jgi:hypothetical protein
VRVTRRGGRVPLECPAGFLWYSKEHSKPGLGVSLWKVAVSGGEETLVVEPIANTSTFAVTQDGIYFIGNDSSEPGMWVRLLNLNTGRSRRIAPIEHTPLLGLTASPDRRWLLYTGLTRRESDLMLIENFR